MSAWLQCLVSPVVYLYNAFYTNRAGNLYTLAHNSQVCYMEAALNDTFDNALRRIYITDGSYDDALYLYLTDEDTPLWLGLISEEGTTTAYPDPEWLYTGAEVSLSIYDFIVWVPVSLSFDPIYMRALINKYRLVSRTRFTILTF